MTRRAPVTKNLGHGGGGGGRGGGGGTESGKEVVVKVVRVTR